MIFLILHQTLNFIFHKILKTDEDPFCSFWDPTLDCMREYNYDESLYSLYTEFFNHIAGYGNWSNIGCYVNSSNDDEVVCHCDHLTSFSILLVENMQCIFVLFVYLWIFYLIGCFTLH